MIHFANDIIAAATDAEPRFLTLRGLAVDPSNYYVGNQVVVLRATDQNHEYALRCYRRKTTNLREIYAEKYYPNELTVNTMAGMHQVDVVLLPWVNGETLAQVVDRGGVPPWSGWLQLAQSMVAAEWAHCDLSPDNIVVGDDGVLSLIDLDSIYLPSFAGQRSPTLGTAKWQSPRRMAVNFNAHTDDFSILLISVVIRVLGHDPSFADRHPSLIDGSKVLDPDYSAVNEVIAMALSKGDFLLHRMAKLLQRGDVIYEELPSLIQYALSEGRLEVDPAHLDIFCEMGIWGYCDSQSGEVVIAPIFDKAYRFRDGQATVSVGGFWFEIDPQGHPFQFD